MSQNARKSKTFSGVCALLFLMSTQLVAAEQVPKAEIGFESAQAMLDWSNRALEKTEQKTSSSHSNLKQVQSYIQFLESLSPADVEKNVEHFAHLQKLKTIEFKILYWQGVDQIQNKSWNETQILQHLEVLRVRNATTEYELVYLKAVKAWDEYYKKSKEVLETYDAFPEKLELKAPLPPDFPMIKGLNLNTLHDLMTILDIAVKHHWRPKPSLMMHILGQIGQAYAEKKAYRLAYEAMEFLAPEDRSQDYQKLIKKFKDQQTEKSKSKLSSGEALY